MKGLHKYRQTLILLIAGGIVGAGAMYGLGLLQAYRGADPNSISRLGGYQLINPLLSCDIGEDTPDSLFNPLKESLTLEASRLKANGQIKRISVYFRDMDYGNWTGVDENQLYAPASLLKVPIMVAYLNDARTDAQLLSTSYSLDLPTDANAEEFFKPPHPLAMGQTYTVDQLLRAMIEGSDNNATAVLLNHVSKSTFADVFDAFGVPPPANQNDDAVSPKVYMRFFRIIYNSTYLGRIRSVSALDMLTKVDFPDGLLRGIPTNIPLANKFGERTVRAADGSIVRRELSDCGIVYYPHSPYGICVMVEGDDFNSLSDAIAQMSKITYEAVDKGLLRGK